MAKQWMAMGELLPILSKGTALLVYSEGHGCYLMAQRHPGLAVPVEVYGLQHIAEHGKTATRQSITWQALQDDGRTVKVCQRFKDRALAFHTIKAHRKEVAERWQVPMKLEAQP